MADNFSKTLENCADILYGLLLKIKEESKGDISANELTAFCNSAASIVKQIILISVTESEKF